MRMAFLSACALITAGCASPNVLYLHSESDAKAVNAAIAGLDASKANHLAFIEGERSFLNASHEIDRGLVLDRLIATRNFHLLRLLDEDQRDPGKTWKNHFEEELKRRAAALLGDQAAFGTTAKQRRDIAKNLKDQLGAPRKIDAQALEGDYRDYERFYRRFVGAQGALVAGSACALGKKLTQTKASESQPKAQSHFTEMQTVCSRILGKIEESCNIALKTPKGLWIEACREDSDTDSGLHMVTAQDVQKLDKLIKLQKTAAKAISKELSDAKTAFKAAKDTELPSVALERKVCEAAGRLNDFITALTPPSESTAETPPAAETEPFCGGKAEQDENGSEAQADTLVTLANDLGASEQVAALFRAERAKIVESKAAEILQEIAAQQPGTEITADNKNTRVALRVIRALGQFRDFRAADDIPSLSALAIAVAANNAAARAAQIEGEYLSSRRSLMRLKLKAIESELYFLAEASNASLASGEDAKRKVARRVAESWLRGRFQSSLMDYDLLNARRDAWLAREEAATVAAYDVISPALSELAVYADGGVKPELVAQILGILGISAVATGVN